jgi:protein gp37
MRKGFGSDGGSSAVTTISSGSAPTENQAETDRRNPVLLAIPARIRFICAEPLLEPVRLDLRGISWVIVGGESGPRARHMPVEWARDVRDQCRAA